MEQGALTRAEGNAVGEACGRKVTRGGPWAVGEGGDSATKISEEDLRPNCDTRLPGGGQMGGACDQRMKVVGCVATAKVEVHHSFFQQARSQGEW